MQKISKLILKNFKFFYGDVKLDFDRQNILIYGENGSGKSSIYWALYTFLQSVFKIDEREIKKYFDYEDKQNLVNRFAEDNAESFIEVIFENDHQSITSRRISKTVNNTNTDTLIKEATQASDFITYKLLAKLYDFKNSKEIDLFDLFADEILMFVNFRERLVRHDEKLDTNENIGTTNASDWWNYISAGLSPRGKMHDPPYKTFQVAVKKFNEELDFYLKKITESVNDYFKLFKQNVKLSFQYKDVVYDPFEEGSTTKRTRKTFPGKIILDIKFDHKKLAEDKKGVLRPQSFLNEARLTTIALAIRFAIFDEKLETDGLAADAPKLLILDDLLLSLDMSNRDNVLEVILNKFTNAQLIVMTHDKHFFALTKHKIKQINQTNWKYFEIYECEKDEIPQPFITESETYLEKAEKYFYLHEYEVAGNFLRKETESLCREFLPQRLQRTKDCNDYDLNGLIGKCKEFAEQNDLDVTLFDELNSHRKFVLNPTSHDSYDVPKFKSEIEKCLQTIKEIRKIRFESVLKKGDILEFELRTANGADIYKFEIIIQDDFRLIKEDGKDSILTSGIVNFYIYKNGVKSELKHEKESLKKMYDKCYANSDKTKNSDFWEEIVVKSSNDKFKSLRKF